jgi:hypothetical protein
LPHSLLPVYWRNSWIVLSTSLITYSCFVQTLCSIGLEHSAIVSIYFGNNGNVYACLHFQLILRALYLLTNVFDLFPWISIVVVYPIIQREFRAGLSPTEYRTSNRMRRFENFSTEYRTLELLHKQAMSIFGVMIIPEQNLVGQFVLYSNYTLIKYWNELDFTIKCVITMMDLTVLCFWFIILEVCGRFYMEAAKSLKSWKLLPVRNRMEAKYLSKFRKASRPLVIGFGEVFKIKRLTVLKFLRGIVKGTFRALLLTIK